MEHYDHYYHLMINGVKTSGIKWDTQSFDALFSKSKSDIDKFFSKNRKDLIPSQMVEDGLYKCMIDYKIDMGNSLFVAIFAHDLNIINAVYGSLFHDIMGEGDVIKLTYFYENVKLLGGVCEIKVKKRRPVDLLNLLKSFGFDKINIDLYKMWVLRKEEYTKSDKQMERNYPYGFFVTKGN